MVLTAQSPNRFDVNKDNKVNISDVVAVINYMATGKDSFITRRYTVNGVQFQMVVVEGGTFLMGSEAYTDEKPIHGVKLNSFSIGQTVMVSTTATTARKALLMGFVFPLAMLLTTLLFLLATGQTEQVAALAALAVLIPYYIYIWTQRHRLAASLTFSIAPANS